MQPLSSVAAGRPIVSGAGARCRRLGCCSFGGLLALMALAAPCEAGGRDATLRQLPRPAPSHPRASPRPRGPIGGDSAKPDVRAAAAHPAREREAVLAARLATPARIEAPRPARESAPPPSNLQAVHLSLRGELSGFGPLAPRPAPLPPEAFADGAGERSAWKPARSRWGLEHGRIAVQLEGGAHLSLRPRHGGLAISLKRNF